MDGIDPALIDWSRAQFALTAMYHWLFVPLTLGLGVLMAIMESIYVRTGDVFWKNATRFWMKLFGINFAMGVATGIILEFEFGTNWSNYSWFVGDVFGAPLAIEGIVAFFMEATFVALMFFGWNKMGRGAHLASTWLTVTGATLSAWWILVANAWMQHPVGMEFNPDTVRNEMTDFMAVAFSPTAVGKFCHTVTSSWVLGALFMAGVGCYCLLKKRHTAFAHASIKVACIFGLVAALLTAHTGHHSAVAIAKEQPMKLAAAEGLYRGGNEVGLVGAGLLAPGTDWTTADDSAFLLRVEIPYALSFLATGTPDGYVPGIQDILEGGYTQPDGTTALSAREKMERGRAAVKALADFRAARKAGNDAAAQAAAAELKENYPCFGYAYINDPQELVPPVEPVFYGFRVMVMLGGYFIALFGGLLLFGKRLLAWKPVQWGVLLSIPLAWVASEAGWVVAEVGRQPWAIQGILPNCAAVSHLGVGSVMATFFIFLILFTLLLLAEIRIMCRAVQEGPEVSID